MKGLTICLLVGVLLCQAAVDGAECKSQSDCPERTLCRKGVCIDIDGFLPSSYPAAPAEHVVVEMVGPAPAAVDRVEPVQQDMQANVVAGFAILG